MDDILIKTKLRVVCRILQTWVHVASGQLIFKLLCVTAIGWTLYSIMSIKHYCPHPLTFGHFLLLILLVRVESIAIETWIYCNNKLLLQRCTRQGSDLVGRVMPGLNNYGGRTWTKVVLANLSLKTSFSSSAMREKYLHLLCNAKLYFGIPTRA